MICEEVGFGSGTSSSGVAFDRKIMEEETVASVEHRSQEAV